MLACNNGKSRYVRSRLLDERLSMAKRGLKGLYKAVIFDLAGSLVHVNSYADYELLNKIIRTLLEKDPPLESDTTDETLDLMRVGSSKLQKLNIDELKSRLAEETQLALNEKIFEAIKKLKRHSFKVSLLTNNDCWAKSRSQSVLEDFQNVDANPVDTNQNQVVSRKDQSEVYEKMLENLQIQPTACILVDHLLSNLRSAEQTGITAIFVDKSQECPEAIQQLEALLNIQLH